jgi:hypothetical protein
MSDIEQTIQATKQEYYRALVELQEQFAERFDALAEEENKSFGSEAKHMAKTLRYEAAKTQRNHLSPSKSGRPVDEKTLALLAELLGLESADFDTIVARIRELADLPNNRRNHLQG